MLQNSENNFFLTRALLFNFLIGIDKTIYCESRVTILFTVMGYNLKRTVDSENKKKRRKIEIYLRFVESVIDYNNLFKKNN